MPIREQVAPADSNQRIIAVIGATGQQGGSLVRAILQDQVFVARALTRNPTSVSAMRGNSQCHQSVAPAKVRAEHYDSRNSLFFYRTRP